MTQEWQYHSSVVTDQSPVEVIRLSVWSRLMDTLPEEIPYHVQVVSKIAIIYNSVYNIGDILYNILVFIL